MVGGTKVKTMGGLVPSPTPQASWGALTPNLRMNIPDYGVDGTEFQVRLAKAGCEGHTVFVCGIQFGSDTPPPPLRASQ